MENIVWLSVEVIFTGVFTVLTFLFMKVFLRRKRNTHIAIKTVTLLILFTATFTTSIYLHENVIIVTSVSVIVAFFIGFVFFEVKIYSAAMAAVFSTIAGGISELTAALLVTSTQEVPLGEVTRLTIYRLQGSTITVLFMLLIILLVKRFRRGRLGAMTTKAMLALCVMPIISAFITLQLAVYVISSPYMPTLAEVVPVVSIAVVNVFFFVFIENIIRQNDKAQKMILIEAQSEAQQKYIILLTERQLQVRTMSHDFKQQVHELNALCAEKKFDELQCKLLELSSREGVNLLVETGNIMLDSILTAKFEIIYNHEIKLKCKFDIAPNLEYFSTDICTLLGNALDNAIEACLRSQDNRFIGVEISATPKQFLCHIINTVGIKPQSDGVILQTSKKDKLHHGVGLQSMMRICRELGGTISFDYDDKNFNLWIELMLSE